MGGVFPQHRARVWSCRRAKLHASEAVAWLAEEGWSVDGATVSNLHAFIDELRTPTVVARRIWHTPVRISRTVPHPLWSSGSPLSLWMQVEGPLRVSSDAGDLTIPPGSMFLHTRPPATVTSTRATARLEILLPRRDGMDTGLPRLVRCDGSPTWSALAGVINAVLNAPEAPDTRTLALYAQSIETLAEALLLETVPMSAVVESDTFTRALELITAHASDPTFTIEVLAQMLGVTRSHVTRLFRERGAMPSRTLKRERVHRARTMLAIDPQIPLEDVARSCGFSSPRLLRESLRPHRARRPDADPLRIP